MLDAENLKIKIKTKAHENNLEPQDIMQMYFFERLLYRISKSKYKNNFILKGGLLLSAIFGDERRTTQDMDTMIKGLPLDIKKLENCGRDKAYEIASNLPHEKRGRQIFVFAEDYEKYYEQKRELALRERENCEKKELNNIYQIKKFS